MVDSNLFIRTNAQTFSPLVCPFGLPWSFAPFLAVMGCLGKFADYRFFHGVFFGFFAKVKDQLTAPSVLAQADGAQVAFQRGFLVVCFYPFGDPGYLRGFGGGGA